MEEQDFFSEIDYGAIAAPAGNQQGANQSAQAPAQETQAPAEEAPSRQEQPAQTNTPPPAVEPKEPEGRDNPETKQPQSEEDHGVMVPDPLELGASSGEYFDTEKKPSFTSVEDLLSSGNLSEDLRKKISESLQPQGGQKPNNENNGGIFAGVSEETFGMVDEAIKSGILSKTDLERGYDPRTGLYAQLNEEPEKFAELQARRAGELLGKRGETLENYVDQLLEDLGGNQSEIYNLGKQYVDREEATRKYILDQYQSERSKWLESEQATQAQAQQQQEQFKQNVISSLREMQEVPGVGMKLNGGAKNVLANLAINPLLIAEQISSDLQSGDPAKFNSAIQRLSLFAFPKDSIEGIIAKTSSNVRRGIVNKERNVDPSGAISAGNVAASRSKETPKHHAETVLDDDQFFSGLFKP